MVARPCRVVDMWEYRGLRAIIICMGEKTKT